MTEIIEITDLSAIALVPYTNTSEAELKKLESKVALTEEEQAMLKEKIVEAELA